MSKPKTIPVFLTNIFFAIGVISALFFRSILIVNTYNVELARLLWYCAIFGYIAFFGFRTYIALKRRKALKGTHIIEKVLSSNCFNEEEKEHLSYILRSLVQSKELYNYVFIFIFSFVAIVLDIMVKGPL